MNCPFVLHQYQSSRGQGMSNFYFFCKSCPKKFLYSKLLKNHGCDGLVLRPEILKDTTTTTIPNTECIKIIKLEDSYVKLKSDNILPNCEQNKAPISTDLKLEDDTKELESIPQNNEGKSHEIKLKQFDVQFGNQTGSSFPCKLCQKCLPSATSLEIHLKIHTIEASLPCQFPDCEEEFPRQKLVWEHMLNTHRVDKETWLGRRFQCDTCNKAFKTKNALHRHKRKHTNDKPLLCSICSKRFKDEKAFYYHTKRHQGLLDFKCPECGQCFVEKSQLNGHILRIHTSTNNYKCDQCNTDFKTKGQLTVHMTHHTGEKAYKCREGCAKQFRIWNTRKSHERTHKGVKEFQCPKCPKMFMQSAAMRTHIRRHEGRKDHVCAKCGWAYVESAGARNCKHSRTRTASDKQLIINTIGSIIKYASVK